LALGNSFMFKLIGARVDVVVSLSADPAIIAIGVVLSLVLLIKYVQNIKRGVAGEMDNSLLTLIVNEAEDLEIA
jgi:hypothetical protein